MAISGLVVLLPYGKFGPEFHALNNQMAFGRDGELTYKKYMCVVCGWIYDEELGAPEDGIAPGTSWQDVPADWQCPDCGAGRDDFDMVEI